MRPLWVMCVFRLPRGTPLPWFVAHRLRQWAARRIVRWYRGTAASRRRLLEQRLRAGRPVARAFLLWGVSTQLEPQPFFWVLQELHRLSHVRDAADWRRAPVDLDRVVHLLFPTPPSVHEFAERLHSLTHPHSMMSPEELHAFLRCLPTAALRSWCVRLVD